MIPARGRPRVVAERVPAAAGRTAVAALALAVVAAGCATVPTNGPVQQVGSAQNGLSQEQEYSQPIPVGPESGWKPTQIVDGFLAASASFAGDHQVAKEYLDPAAQAAWHPGWAVTVVRGQPKTTSVGPFPKSVPNQSDRRAQVKVTGVPVATITGSGQYQVYSGSLTKSYVFSLVSVDGQWRIDSLPTSQGLLLTQADFQHVYQPRDLYFLSQSANTLVPDPVFVPQQATNTDLATGLVKALLQDPTGWLTGAAVTGFPAHAHPIGQVRIDGQNATVDLGGEHGKPLEASQQQLKQMAAQLAWTLASGPVQSVELELNNQPKRVISSLYQEPQDYQSWMPAQPAGSSLYFVGSNGTVQALSGAGQSSPGQEQRVTTVPGQAGSGNVPALTSIAISPKGPSVAGIAAGGAAVYFGALGRGATLKEWRPTSGSCTSVSWDARGDLWVTAGGIVWMLPPNGGSATAVEPVAGGADVTDFVVAPDDVRVVMIVRDGSNSHVEVGAVTHSGQAVMMQGDPVTIGAGIPQPDALAWYGTDNVMVLADSGSSSSAQLYEVPLNGGPPNVISAPGAPTSVTATSPEGSAAYIAIGLPGGKIMVSTDLGAFEPTRAGGQFPAYPS